MSERRKIDDRYELQAVIGRGGHGVVYRALDTRTGSPVALKFLNDSVAADPEYNARMEREAQAMSTLAGTSALQVYELRISSDSARYLVMELLEGQDLEQHLEGVETTGNRVSPAYMFELLDPIADTLEIAHIRGIVHRDLKPRNIFVLDSGGVRLLDFGLAKVMSAAPLTQDGIIAGSPSYIAPEAWRGNPRALDHRIDIYSLGAITFRVLAGRVPFKSDSLIEMFRLVTSGQRPSLHAERPELPPEIDHWMTQCLAIDPEARFLRIRAMWNALKDVLS